MQRNLPNALSSCKIVHGKRGAGFFLSFQFLIKYIQIQPSMVHFSDDVRAHVYLQVQEMASLHNYLSDYSVIRLLASGVQLSTWTHPCCNAWHICVWNWGKLRDCWGGLKVHIDTPSESLFQAVWYNWNTIEQLASYKLHVQNQRKSSLLFSRVNNSHHLTICDIVQSQKLIGYLCLYRYIYI